MKSIAEILQETIKVEEEKKSKDTQFQEFESLLKQLEKLDSTKRPEYSLPLTDTIGKTYSSALNKHLAF